MRLLGRFNGKTAIFLLGFRGFGGAEVVFEGFESAVDEGAVGGGIPTGPETGVAVKALAME